MRTLLTGIAVLAAVAAFSPAATAAEREPTAQAVVQWNQIAREAIARGLGSNVSTAMVQVAVYDAVTAIDGRYEPFATHIRAPRGAYQEAATAAATHGLLVLMFPAQRAILDPVYADYLAGIPDGWAKRAGVASTTTPGGGRSTRSHARTPTATR